ncbi:MAG TPA: 4-hydroxy-3-methylbut-2-enyl diphosphate reductase [Pyrinomonadaceae bacterium]|nr:4-hydroxy-3-methylbut-2-enyl diphosphate reductase [Pyrinomonadaceae bacterium]
MQVLLAEEYGFCFGVERAVEMVEGALSQGARVRTLGPLIHNTQEIQRLETHGVATIDSPAEVEGEVTAVIRAHGVTPQVQRELETRASQVIDATCPFVTKVQKLAERAAAEGRDVVIVGNPDHPEMIGVVGYAPANSHVVRDASEVASLPAPLRAPLVVSQTTIKLSTFLEAAEAVRAKSDSEPQIVNTICSATRDRQDAARALAGHVEAFYVIGGKHSSNSLKLLSVCKEECERSFLIETPEEINAEDLRGLARVGVTAGASTPNWLIEQVVARLREIGEAQEETADALAV